MATNPMAYSSRDVGLDVLRAERSSFYEVIAHPDSWLVDSRCEGWQGRDLVGHLIAVSESYLARWELARRSEYPDPLGWQLMAAELNKGALALRSLPREEAIARLKAASAALMDIFEALTEEEWSGFKVGHVFAGPVPALCYPAFQIMDYGVHSWDMQWGLGKKDGQLDERTAGVLLPFMFVIWQGTVDQQAAEGLDLTYGVKVDGEWGGQ